MANDEIPTADEVASWPVVLQGGGVTVDPGTLPEAGKMGFVVAPGPPGAAGSLLVWVAGPGEQVPPVRRPPEVRLPLNLFSRF